MSPVPSMGERFVQRRGQLGKTSHEAAALCSSGASSHQLHVFLGRDISFCSQNRNAVIYFRSTTGSTKRLD